MEKVLIRAEAPMLDRIAQWASRNNLKVGSLPVMWPGVPLSLEVTDASYASLVFNLGNHTVSNDGAVIGYWSYNAAASEHEGCTVRLIEPMGLR